MIKSLELIKYYEKFKAKPYLCPAGKLTIGYGETKGVTTDMVWTEEYASLRLAARCDEFLKEIKKYIKVPLNDNQLGALVSFVYNIGVDAFSGSTLLKKINANDLQGAALEFSKWNKARVHGNLVPLAGLTKRRQAESQLFSS